METRQGPTDSRVTQLECWPEVQVKIRAGEKIQAIVDFIQKEKKEYVDVKPDSLRRQLARIKMEMTPGTTQAEQSEAKEQLKELQEAVDEVKSSEEPEVKKRRNFLAVLEEAMELFSIQMERVAMGRTLETQLKYMIKSMTSDIAEARECLKFVFEVQQELGLTRKPAGEDGYDDKYRLLSFEQRQRVLKALDLVRDRLKQQEIEDKRLEKAAEETVIDVTVAEEKKDELPFE